MFEVLESFIVVTGALSIFSMPADNMCVCAVVKVNVRAGQAVLLVHPSRVG